MQSPKFKKSTLPTLNLKPIQLEIPDYVVESTKQIQYIQHTKSAQPSTIKDSLALF